MSQENVEIAKRAIAAINETYQAGDMLTWREYVEETCDPEIVLEAGPDVFTEGQWHGHEGVVGFVANQMEVLDGMWLRLDEYIYVHLLNTFGHEAEDVAYQVGHTDGGVLIRKLYGHPSESLARQRLKANFGRKVVPLRSVSGANGDQNTV